METRQTEQAAAEYAWLPGEEPALGLIDAVCRQPESPVEVALAADRLPEARRAGARATGDPLGEPPSWQAAARYHCLRMGRLPQDKDDLINLLSRDVAELDRLLGEQVNAILHHPRFQAMESAWRGVWLLLEGAGDQENLKIKVLNLTKAQLDADLHDVIEFDQSDLFHKVYEEEFGLAGGEPYGALIGNYEFRNSPGDVSLLSKIKEVAAAAFAPFVASVDPMIFGVQQFSLLARINNLDEVFGSLKFVKWNALREHEDSRFLGLVLPRILMRLPYGRDSQRVDGFVFEEDVSAGDGSSYLWGNAAFAFGHVLARAFALSGWFADIRGTGQGPDSGGVVELPAHSYRTDRPGVAVKCSVDSIVSESRDKELSDLGFIALCDCEDTDYSAFFANQSMQKPRTYHDEVASGNARLSAMLQYVLCASRFAHYLKVIGRGKIGQTLDRDEIQMSLHNWIHQYVADDSGVSASTRARFPLREAKVEVDENPSDPGHFRVTLFLAPHIQLDQLSAGIKLVTQLPKS
jgi:type VI secretion system protein ImpC